MKNDTAKILALCGLALGGLAATACGGSAKPSAAPSEAADAPAAQESAPASAGGAPAPSASAAAAPPEAEAPTPLGQVLMTDASEMQKLYEAAKSAPPATLNPNGLAGGDALVKGIREIAKRLPGGMKPDGPLATGTLKEKQHLQTDITLQPGKCYSIVGYSKSVKDLDLYLFAVPGVLSGQDISDDNRPVVGGPPQPLCPVATVPLSYKLDVVAESGAGDVAIQLISKGN